MTLDSRHTIHRITGQPDGKSHPRAQRSDLRSTNLMSSELSSSLICPPVQSMVSTRKSWSSFTVATCGMSGREPRAANSAHQPRATSGTHAHQRQPARRTHARRQASANCCRPSATRRGLHRGASGCARVSAAPMRALTRRPCTPAGRTHGCQRDPAARAVEREPRGGLPSFRPSHPAVPSIPCRSPSLAMISHALALVNSRRTPTRHIGATRAISGTRTGAASAHPTVTGVDLAAMAQADQISLGPRILPPLCIFAMGCFLFSSKILFWP